MSRPDPQAPAFDAARASGPVRCLLDLDTDLADELEVDVRRAARAAATAVTVHVDPGCVPVQTWLAANSGGVGILVIDGAVATDVSVGGRTAAEIIGAGDLIQAEDCAHDELLAWDVAWRALLPTRFALLDRSFAKRVRFWPQITQALLRRAGSRTHDLNVQRAIAIQPRLEVRLTLLLWHLAARWGKVEPGGIRLPLPLTHQLLGRLVGAERPSVSHALTRLARSGLVTGHGDEWHLHGSVEQQLYEMNEPTRGRVEGLAVADGSLRRR